MNGKKVAIYFVGFIVLVCVLIVVIMKIFFATYEPKTNNEEEAISYSTYVDDNASLIELI